MTWKDIVLLVLVTGVIIVFVIWSCLRAGSMYDDAMGYDDKWGDEDERRK